MSKKFKPEDATPEQIQRDIELAMADEDIKNVEGTHISKIFTFIMLFLLYIFLSIYITEYPNRILFLSFGIIALITILQVYIVHPRIKSNNKKLIE